MRPCQFTGSPAVDAVTNGTCPPPAKDQRGVMRPQDGNGDGGPARDVGSYEFVFTVSAPVQAPQQPVAPAPTQPVTPEPNPMSRPGAAPPSAPPPPASTPPDQAITEPAPETPAEPVGAQPKSEPVSPYY